MVNAHIIYQECNGNIARLKRYPSTFRNDLITGLTAGYSQQVRRIGRLIPPAAEDRLCEHEHKLVPIPGWNCKFEPNSEACKVCSDKGQITGRRHRTTTKCNKCQVAMCVYPCFDLYHTLLNYQTCCKDYENGEFHGPVTIPVAERPLKGVVRNNKWLARFRLQSFPASD